MSVLEPSRTVDLAALNAAGAWRSQPREIPRALALSYEELYALWKTWGECEDSRLIRRLGEAVSSPVSSINDKEFTDLGHQLVEEYRWVSVLLDEAFHKKEYTRKHYLVRKHKKRKKVEALDAQAELQKSFNRLYRLSNELAEATLAKA